ncbi:MAG TPA: efflux RND transporter periplasmic adaptor subunit [Gemmataceae bacterium]|nr:efflux RND transporter periplasmic adaptor subunit [Gemmataceae bacterium]
MNHHFLSILCCVGSLLAGMLTGCGHAPEQAAAESLIVPVSQPVARQVTDFVDYTGRLAAINSVDIRPRVTGYLMKMPFEEGKEVKKDDLLFQIDPRPYQALVDQAAAQVKLNEARRRLARANNTRAKTVAVREPGSFSQQELETYQAQELESDASLKASQASLEIYKLNLGFCEVRSPIAGRVSRYYYTLGNLVNQDQTPLTTVVSLDPIYAYFDMDERTVLEIRKRINEGKIKVAKDTTDIPVFMALEGETGYAHKGFLNFINNQVNPQTGTISVRGKFDNPEPSEGRRLLMPGMFVRIHLPIGQAHAALLVADRAIGSDQGLKFVYVVNKDNKIEYRRVTTGALQEDGLRVFEPYKEKVNDEGKVIEREGVRPDEWVVVGALPQIRPKMEVEPEQMAMPTIDAGQVPSPVPPKPQPPPAGENKPPTPAKNQK